MSLGNVDLLNKVANSTAFTTATGNNTHGEGETITEFLSFDSNGNSISVKDSDNETFNLSLSALAEELGMSIDTLKAELGVDKLKKTGETEGTDETKGTTETKETSKTDKTKSSKDIEKEIEGLKADKEESMAQLKALEATIKELSSTIEKKLEEAAKKQEIKIEEHQEAVEKAIAENVNKYIEASKSEKPMTQDELQANIKTSIAGIDGIPKGADDVLSNLFTINSELSLLDANLAKVKGLTSHVKDIDTQIQGKTNELKVAKEAEEAAQKAQECTPPPKSCDPIGFTDANGNRFDFIKIDDAFDSTSDFLGADKQWDEMKALDTTGKDGAADGKVDINELKEANIGLVMTNADGVKEVMTADKIAEMFGDDFTIDLNSYKEGGEHDAVSAGDHDGDGTVDQQLLGTFTVNGSKMAEEGVKGYNTLDDVDWLSEKYGVEVAKTAPADGTTAPAPVDGAKDTTKADETKDTNSVEYFESFYEEYSDNAKKLRETLNHLWEMQGLNEEYIKLIDKSAFVIAENKTADVKTKPETEETGKAEGTGEAEGADEKDGTPGVGKAEGTTNEGAEDDPDKKDDNEDPAKA